MSYEFVDMIKLAKYKGIGYISFDDEIDKIRSIILKHEKGYFVSVDFDFYDNFKKMHSFYAGSRKDLSDMVGIYIVGSIVTGQFSNIIYNPGSTIPVKVKDYEVYCPQSEINGYYFTPVSDCLTCLDPCYGLFDDDNNIELHGALDKLNKLRQDGNINYRFIGDDMILFDGIKGGIFMFYNYIMERMINLPLGYIRECGEELKENHYTSQELCKFFASKYGSYHVAKKDLAKIVKKGKEVKDDDR